ncbi:hypothetical protein [Halovulum sp. GXIMD14793]
MIFDVTNPFARRPRFLARLPRLVRFIIFHWMIGYLIAALFTALVFGLNIGGISQMVLHSEGSWIAGLAFYILNGILFAGAQVSVAVSLHLSD